MCFETYQKILNEAIEELKEEKFNDLFKGKKSNLYLKECQLDTDLEILIPEDYVSNTNERLNLYKEINTFKTEEEITQFSKRLTDRFGPAPKIMCNLFSAIRLKWSAKKIGFEKIILKNKKMTVILPDKEKESYYNSSLFQNILKYLKINSEHILLEEKNNKLYLKIKEVNKIQKALEICTEILS